MKEYNMSDYITQDSEEQVMLSVGIFSVAAFACSYTYFPMIF